LEKSLKSAEGAANRPPPLFTKVIIFFASFSLRGPAPARKITSKEFSGVFSRLSVSMTVSAIGFFPATGVFRAFSR